MSDVSNIEDKLAVNKYTVDKQVHITIDSDICKLCQHHNCVYCCPAGCYKLSQGNIVYSYEGCLECGSCYISCPENAIELTFPRAGFGILYEYG
jgi:ferredoxin like protein